MPLPEIDVKKARRWVERQNEQIRGKTDQIRIELDVTPRGVSIVECEAPWAEELGPEWQRREVARLRYLTTRRLWTLYWPDRNDKFHRYDDLDPMPTIDRLLTEVEMDPTCIFWG